MQGPFDPNGTQVPPQSFPADVCSPDETVSIDRSYDAVKELDGKTYYLPLEVGNALTKNWFWTPNSPPESLEDLKELYSESVGLGRTCC